MAFCVHHLNIDPFLSKRLRKPVANAVCFVARTTFAFSDGVALFQQNDGLPPARSEILHRFATAESLSFTPKSPSQVHSPRHAKRNSVSSKALSAAVRPSKINYVRLDSTRHPVNTFAGRSGAAIKSYYEDEDEGAGLYGCRGGTHRSVP